MKTKLSTQQRLLLATLKTNGALWDNKVGERPMYIILTTLEKLGLVVLKPAPDPVWKYACKWHVTKKGREALSRESGNPDAR